MITAVALALVGLTRLLFNVVIGWHAGFGDLGLFNTAISIAILVSSIIAIGIGAAASKYCAEYIGRKRENDAKVVVKTGVMMLVLSLLAATAVVLAISDLLAKLIGIPHSLLLLCIPIIPLYGGYSYFRYIFYALGRYKRYVFAEFVAQIAFITAIIGIGFLYISIAPVAFLVLYLVFVILVVFEIRDYLKGKVDLRKYGPIIGSFALISIVGSIASQSKRDLSIIAASRYDSFEVVGIYSILLSIIPIISFMPRIIATVIFPELSHQYGKGMFAKIRSIVERSTRYIAVATGFVCGALYFLSDQIIWGLNLIGRGDDVTGMLPNFSIVFLLLLVGTYLLLLGVPSASALLASKYVQIPNAVSIGMLFVTVAVWISLGPMYGILAIALGLLVSSMLDSMLNIYFCEKKLKADLRPVGYPLLVFIISLLVGIVISLPEVADKLRLEYPLIIGGVVFSLLYIVLLRGDIIRILKSGIEGLRRAA